MIANLPTHMYSYAKIQLHLSLDIGTLNNRVDPVRNCVDYTFIRFYTYGILEMKFDLSGWIWKTVYTFLTKMKILLVP